METDSENDKLYPLALLIDELKHDDVAVRLNAMNELPTISQALGIERTRSELIPFLEEVTQEDEDEVLTVLARELGQFVPLVGGAEYAYILLPPLETLSGAEEPLVRDKATESLNQVSESMSAEQVHEHFMPLIKRLAGTSWFTSRVSATALYAGALVKLTSKQEQQDFLATFQELAFDEAPMVRRAAATNLARIIGVLPEVEFDGVIKTMFESQVADDQDSARLLSVEVLIALAEKLKSQSSTKYTQELIDYAVKLFEDKSWRVRYMAADRFEKLAVALDSPEMRSKFTNEFVTLMKDNEAEVRTAIAKQIPGFCALLSKDEILETIVPNINSLAADASQHVRAALAAEISRLAPLLGEQETTAKLLPIFLVMLEDEYPDVRLNVISKLQIVNQVIGVEKLSQSLLPAIRQLAKDKQWRVRLAIIDYIPLLAEQFDMAFFDTELGPLCMEWLWDSVYTIREAATENLKKLTSVFGVEWAKTEIIPSIQSVGEKSNYLYRLTALFAMTRLVPVMDETSVTQLILPFIESLAKDPVPNIRFNVAKALKVIVDKCPENKSILDTTVIPTLNKLSEDSDVDVRYFADQSLEEMQAAGSAAVN